MLQLVYVSSATPALIPIDPTPILDVSRRNNQRDEITGALYSDGQRFLQALEGSEAAVDAAFARIGGDRRHRAIVTLSRRTIAAREFGDWAMAHFTPGDTQGDFLARVGAMVANASPNVRATFEGFAQHRRGG